MRNVAFPASDGQQRAVMGVTVVLVAITLAAAVATSSSPTKETAATAATPTSTAPAETAPPSTTPASTQPTATTGTPAPPSSPAAKPQKIALEADPAGQLTYSQTTLKAKAGTVTIEFMNTSPVEHNVTVEQGNKNVLGATPTFTGGKRSLTLKLSAGTYTFFCSVPGHRQAGMEGKLVVSS
jgi:plastocyanin